MSVKFPAGRYYVGDLCYVIDEGHWDKILEQSGYFGYKLNSDQWFGVYEGYKVFAGFTAHGDGCYDDNFGNLYGVDAGLIGIIDANWLDVNEAAIECLGAIHDFKDDFEVSMPERGLFHFGEVTIDTRGESLIYCECEEDGCDWR